MSLQLQNYLSIAIAVVLAGIGVIMAGKAEDFGLSPVAVRWLGVVVAMLGAVQPFLHQVTPDRLQGKEN